MEECVSSFSSLSFSFVCGSSDPWGYESYPMMWVFALPIDGETKERESERERESWAEWKQKRENKRIRKGNSKGNSKRKSKRKKNF